MSEGNNSYPQWLGLLKWSLSQTDPNGSGSDFTAMSEENREFLEAVMKDMVKDEPGDLQKILLAFQDMIDRGLTHEDNDKVLRLLEDTQDIIDQIDMANVFLKFGGATVLKQILLNENLEDPSKCAASVICGELAQNNPEAQIEMIKFGLLDQLAVLCASPETADKLCTKSLYGVSCIIRGSKDGENRFCDSISGPALLKRLLKRQHSACSKRVMFLANALLMSDFCNDTPTRTPSILSSIFPDVLFYMDSDDVDVRETFLRLLCTVVSSPERLEYLLPFLPALQVSLNEKVNLLSDEENNFERGLVQEILHIIDK